MSNAEQDSFNISRRTAMNAIMATGASAFGSVSDPVRKRSFTLDLRCGSIGVNANQLEAIELAHKHGFESVTPDPGFLANLDAAKRNEMQARMKQHNVRWGAAGLPVEFRKDENTFKDGLKQFPRLAEGMQRAGVTRVGTYIMPFHDSLTYMANFKQHARRLRECIKVMADHGQRFGLEYVGTKTLWTRSRHSFIHSMAETKELLAEIGMKNAGFILDSWHWYTAGETAADIKTLTNADIVACDLNDAPKGVAVDKQIDNQRELPVATGVIDLTAFLTALTELGYDGPIRAEPFNAPLNQLDNNAACAATAKAMKAAFALVQQ